MTIWKYDVPNPGAVMEIEMPMRAEFLSLQVQHGKPVMWWRVSEASPRALRRFVCVGTGHEADESHKYIGTYLDGAYVWHVFIMV